MTPYLYHVFDAHLTELTRAAAPGASRPAAAAPLPAALTQRLEAAAADAWPTVYLSYFADAYGAPEGVFVLPVRGCLYREGWMGYEMLRQLVRAAAQDDRYGAGVLKLHTPGGAVDGCATLADALADFGKPLLSHTSYCASAGVFLASQTDEIWLEDGVATQFGSVGTLLIYENYAQWLEQQGIDLTIYRADRSPDKARTNPWEPLTPDGEAAIRALVNAAQREFEGYVKRGRTGRNLQNEALTGRLYGAREAVRLGLADRTGSFEACLKAAATAAKRGTL